MKKPLYCITAINRLTRERERVSAISSDKEILKSMRHNFLRNKPLKRTHIYPHITVVTEKLF